MNDVTEHPDDTYFQDLMGAAAFGHLDAAEQEGFDAWLASSTQGRQEFSELVAAVQLLPLSLDESVPSPALRDRIARAVGAADETSSRPEPVAAEPVSIEEARGRRGSFFASPTGRILAIAAVFAVVVIGAWAIFASIAGDTVEDITIASAPEGFDGTLAYNVDTGRLEVDATSMPAAPSGQVYQLWLIRGDEPVSQGVMTGNTAEIEANRSDWDAFAITIEPGPDGSAGPTSDPILVAPLAKSDDGADV